MVGSSEPSRQVVDDDGRVLRIERAGEVLHGDLLLNPDFVVLGAELKPMVASREDSQFDVPVPGGLQGADGVEGVLDRDVQILRGMEHQSGSGEKVELVFGREIQVVSEARQVSDPCTPSMSASAS